LRGVHAHRPKNLLCIALAPSGNVRLAGHPCPGGVQGGRLAE
jgi:hypothetical protein